MREREQLSQALGRITLLDEELTETLEPRKRRVKPEPEMLHRRLTRQGN